MVMCTCTMFPRIISKRVNMVTLVNVLFRNANCYSFYKNRILMKKLLGGAVVSLRLGRVIGPIGRGIFGLSSSNGTNYKGLILWTNLCSGPVWWWHSRLIPCEVWRGRPRLWLVWPSGSRARWMCGLCMLSHYLNSITENEAKGARVIMINVFIG